jgi:RNA polymerase sigma-70 factor (ECF subfamily)
MEAHDLDGDPDHALLRRARAGSADAWNLLYRRRSAGIYRFALRMTGREALAEDVTQEVFAALLSETHRFDAARGSLAPYLFGIARKQVLRHLEREQRYVGDAVREPVHEETPQRLAARAETVEAVRRAILTLPPVFREAVVLCELQELRYAEAAAAVGVPLGTLRSRLHRGRRLLSEALREAGAA